MTAQDLITRLSLLPPSTEVLLEDVESSGEPTAPVIDLLLLADGRAVLTPFNRVEDIGDPEGFAPFNTARIIEPEGC